MMEGHVKSGIIEAVHENDEDQQPTHFLQRYGAIRQDRETTKLCVVFHRSAKAVKSTPSINEGLQKGANSVHYLFDVVVEFQGYSVAIVADIEKAFHPALNTSRRQRNGTVSVV